jgi:predicted ATP-grasp superfamily ATP-dependent carboligase
MIVGRPMAQESVLVLGNFAQTLAVVRSLGRAGYRIVLGRAGQTPIAESSRFCHEIWRHPELDDPEFSAALREFLARRPDIRYAFPVAWPSMQALMDMPDSARLDIVIAMVPPDLVRACMDKPTASALAQRAGLRIPESRVARSIAELDGYCRDIEFPVIVKPLGIMHSLLGNKALILASSDERQRRLPVWPAEHEQLMVQKYVSGTLEAADFVAQAGVIVGYCEAHSVRTDTLDGTGFGVEFESIPPSPDVLDATRAFVRALRYSGPGLIQFMRSAESGQLYFLENNPRLSAGVADSIAWGQDMPLVSLRAIAARSDDELPEFDPRGQPYLYGRRAYWLQRDIEGLLKQRARLSLGQKVRGLGAMVRSFARADSHINWQWNDPLPCISSYAGLLRRTLVGLRSRLQR